MKPGDNVRITAKEDELKYIPSYNRTIILNTRKGTVYKRYGDNIEVSCGLAGIHEFKINQLEVI